MTAILDLTETQVLTALRAVLGGILPAGTPIIKAQVNRVPEPREVDFVLMTPILRERLATNIDSWSDAVLLASIADATLTVDDIEGGVLRLGSPILGTGIAAGTVVTAFGSGTGGVGTYTVSPAAQTIAQEAMYAGLKEAEQRTELTIQLDVHGPASADNAQRIATLWRDEYTVQAFADTNLAVAPLYMSDPRQVPFINAEAQYENRWVVDACLQANVTASVLQQFADQLAAELVAGDAA